MSEEHPELDTFCPGCGNQMFKYCDEYVCMECLKSSLAKSEERVKELEEVANENYTDLLEQMDEAWGSAMEIGRPEVNAMIESRRVHKPTSSLREKNTRLTTALEKLKDREWVATQFFMVGVTPEGEFDSFKVWDFIFAELDKIVEGRNDNQ